VITQTTSTRIVWSLRILLSLLFLVSAFAKLYPRPGLALEMFEFKQLTGKMGMNENFAAWFSRTLIGIEFALGLLLVMPHYFRKITLPASFLMLLVFNVHLFMSGNEGNCGCFGELIPMTPNEAIVKNFIAMILMGAVFYLHKLEDKKNLLAGTTVLFGCIMTVFMIGMPKKAAAPKAVQDVEIEQTIDSSGVKKTVTTINGKITTDIKNGGQVDTLTEAPKVSEPKPKKTVYSTFFSDADKGKKLICFFAPGCDHCQEAAKEIAALKKSVKGFPEIRVIFMDEEPEKIPDFEKTAGMDFASITLDIVSFMKTIGVNRDTPCVFYQWNGNTVKEWQGINDQKFKKDEMKKLATKTWDELK
jgi:hypothetical protein